MGAEAGAVPTCPVCGGAWASGLACASCRQVDGLPSGIRLTSRPRRAAEPFVEALLAIVLLYVGWLVWSLVVYRRGQSPAKQLLRMRVVVLETRRRAGSARMLARELPAKALVGVAALVSFGVVLLWPLWDERRQALWDKLVETIVVDDPFEEL